MQQIERYGVIALVFLLVTIVAISFWGDSKSPGFWSRLTGKNQPKEIAKIDPPALPGAIADPSLPLSDAQPISESMPTNSLGQQPIETPGLGSQVAPPPSVVVIPGPTDVAAGPMTAPNGGTVTPPIDLIAQQPPAPAAASSGEYVVQRGDSMARIARNALGAESRWQEIAALNPNVDPKSLDVGQRLAMPTGAALLSPKANGARTETKTAPKSTPKATPKSTSKDAVVAAPKKSEKPASSVRACVVQKGDTLRSIARRELGDERRWKEIAGANPGVDPSKLAIGMRLKLPKGEAVLVASGPSAPSPSKVQSTSKPRVQ